MADTLAKLKSIEEKASNQIEEAKNLEDVENLRIEYTGRKSPLTEILRTIKDLSPEEKSEIGKTANSIKSKLSELLEDRKNQLQNTELESQIENEWLDVTRPSKPLNIGKEHPISQMMDLTIDIFGRMGFETVFPNEIDTEFNNFTAVNIPENHPARDMWDTFWTEDNHVAITHTSSMQHRILKEKEPPIRVIVPGRTFRNEATDARHEHTFYQIEGIYIDRGINMSHMLGTLKAFFTEFFEAETDVLFTPDFFPFVEPGGMMSINTSNLGEGFKKVTKGTDWLEILGCGMVHPNVLDMAGIDPNVYSGFAWGIGLERLIMLKYGIDDLRVFHTGDLRFVRQF